MSSILEGPAAVQAASDTNDFAPPESQAGDYARGAFVCSVVGQGKPPGFTPAADALALPGGYPVQPPWQIEHTTLPQGWLGLVQGWRTTRAECS
jgi:hypothetical protein